MLADGTCVASGSEDSTVRVWQVKDDKWSSTVSRDHESLVRSVTKSADGTYCVWLVGQDGKSVGIEGRRVDVRRVVWSRELGEIYSDIGGRYARFVWLSGQQCGPVGSEGR